MFKYKVIHTSKYDLMLLNYNKTYYLFDFYNIVLIKVSKEMYDCLKSNSFCDNIIKEEFSYLLKENLFKNNYRFTADINHYINHIVLQLTQACNLRCIYCFGQSPKNINNVDVMNVSVAKKV